MEIVHEQVQIHSIHISTYLFIYFNVSKYFYNLFHETKAYMSIECWHSFILVTQLVFLKLIHDKYFPHSDYIKNLILHLDDNALFATRVNKAVNMVI